MTMDVMRAIQSDGQMPTSTSVVYIENTLHVIEPVRHEEAGVEDETGKHSYSLMWLIKYYIVIPACVRRAEIIIKL